MKWIPHRRVFESPSIHPSRTLARSTLRPVQHRPREASYKIFQPLHRRGTRKQCRFEKDAQPESPGRTLQLCLDLEIQKIGAGVQGDPQTLRAVHPQSDPEGHEGNAVRIKHLEAGAASLVARIGMETEFPLSPSGSVRRCVRTQAVRARSLCSGLCGRVGSP